MGSEMCIRDRCVCVCVCVLACIYVCACVCACECVCACVRACVHACARAIMCVPVFHYALYEFVKNILRGCFVFAYIPLICMWAFVGCIKL